MRKCHLLALLLAALFFLIRLIDLGENPKGFFCDEASIAYNAKSILETGKDEHGEFLPLFFEAFGEYKPPFYIYSTALTLSLFEDIHFATRLPAAIFLGLLLLAVYALLARIVHPVCGLMAILLLGNEPWVHHFSHVAFGLTLTPLLLILALIFWLQGIKQQAYFLCSAVLFAATFYSYPPARVFVPLFVLALIILYRAELWATLAGQKKLTRFLLVAFLCSLPFQYYLFYVDGFLSRVGFLNIFTSANVEHSWRYQWLKWFLTGSILDPLVLSNDFLLRPLLGVIHYLSFYSPEHLFFHGATNLRFGPASFGVLSFPTMVGVFIGVAFLILRRNTFDKVLLAWLALYAIPGALTWEDIPHTGRGIVGYLCFDIIAAYGLWEVGKLLFARKLWGKILSVLLGVGVGGLLIFHCALFYPYYSSRFSADASGWMQYGFREMMEYIAKHHDRYKRTWIISTGLHYQPYIFALLYSDLDPATWQAGSKLPWNVTLLTREPRPEELDSNDLYIFTPIPKNLPTTFALRKMFFWEHGQKVAFGAFSYTAVQKEVPLP